MSLFPTPQRPRHLVEFNAGKCYRDGNMMKPDLRKGLIYMDQTDDQLLHFYWKDRKANIVEEDLIIFPEEAEMVPVPECETGRVFLLKFKSSSQKLFFWMQNANDEKDKENVDRVNKLINDLQSALNDQHGRSGRAEGDDEDSAADVLSLLGSSGQELGLTQEQIYQFLQSAGGVGSVTLSSDGDDHATVTITARDTESDAPALDADLLRALKEVVSSQSVSDDAPLTSDVGEVLSADEIGSILNDEEISEAVFPTIPYVKGRSTDEVNTLVQEDEFRTSLRKLEAAYRAEELEPFAEALKVEPSGGLASFIKALQKQAKDREDGADISESMDED
ncbi:proteasome complex subunit Rpn13 ubiquitin receptor-domain-containing protein [Umbelopsis sp. AD052]|nr:proteasome complex subunit Rpn13 ubiquitin receptor-domain-containing protein [Umbelopsis sp. AD052]